MKKFDFIKPGRKVFWRDPDHGISSGEYEVVSVPEVIEKDSVIMIASEKFLSEAEVYPSELQPT